MCSTGGLGLVFVGTRWYSRQDRVGRRDMVELGRKKRKEGRCVLFSAVFMEHGRGGMVWSRETFPGLNFLQGLQEPSGFWWVRFPCASFTSEPAKIGHPAGRRLPRLWIRESIFGTLVVIM